MQRHILLITIDSLRADHVSCYGCSPVATPALDAFAAAGVRLDPHLTSISATLASHACLMTGCTPKVQGVTWNGQAVKRRRRTLAEIAAEAGYATHAITSWQGFLDQEVYGFQQWHSHHFSAHKENRGDRTLERVKQWIAQVDLSRPQFLWVHLIDPHAPDISPDPYPSTYQGSVAFTDTLVNELLQAWDSRFPAEGTIAVITADHGEHLNDHGVERGHGTLWEICLRVPLLMRAPGLIVPGKVVSELTRQIDLAPTVLDYASLPMPHNMEGMSLRGLIEGVDVDLRLVHHAQAIHDGVYTATIRNAEYSLHFGDGQNLAGLYDRRQDPAEVDNHVRQGAVVRHSEAHSLADAAAS